MEDGIDAMDMDRQPPEYTLAQLTYAPTITETVVTTRTITKTSYPPFILHESRNLKERDPEVYPLLNGPTPALLKKVRLELGGKTAFFEETERPQEQLDQVCHRKCKPKTCIVRANDCDSIMRHAPHLRQTTASSARPRPQLSILRQSTNLDLLLYRHNYRGLSARTHR